MSYSVQIERIGPYGIPNSSPTVTIACSENEAIGIFSKAIELARKLTYPMQFSVFGPGNRLLINYTNERRDEGGSDQDTP